MLQYINPNNQLPKTAAQWSFLVQHLSGRSNDCKPEKEYLVIQQIVTSIYLIVVTDCSYHTAIAIVKGQVKKASRHLTPLLAS